MRRSIIPLAWCLFVGSTASAGTAFPGLPIETAPVASDKTMSLAELDRLVAAERQRLEAVARPQPQPAAPTAPPAPPPGRLVVTEGITTAIAVGLGHVNRLRTPFAAFRVLHQSSATISKQGAALYVTPADARPLTVFIEDKQPPHRAIGLLLRPHAELPPVQVALEMEGAPQAGSIRSESGTSAFPDHIRDLLRRIAMGQLPAGFTRHPADVASTPDCGMPGISVEALAVVASHDYRIVLSRVRNETAMTLAFDESACADDQTLAVATYPEQWLVPGGMLSLMQVRAVAGEATP